MTEKNDEHQRQLDVEKRLSTIEGRGTGYAASWAIALSLLALLVGLCGLAIAVWQLKGAP